MRARRKFTCAAVAVVAVMGSAAGHAAAAAHAGGGAATVAPAVSAATVVRLSRLHHVANRQAELGRLAQTAAGRPETRSYGARLVSDFRALDNRIDALASSLGVDPARLDRVYAGENTAALARESEDLTRLATARGDDFDRQFFVIMAQDQLAASDMLLPVAGADPRLEPAVAEISRQLEASSQEALVAARPVAGPAHAGVPAAVVPTPDIPAAPVTMPGPSGISPTVTGGPFNLPPPAR